MSNPMRDAPTSFLTQIGHGLRGLGQISRIESTEGCLDLAERCRDLREGCHDLAANAD